MRTASTPFYKSGDDYLPNNAALELGATGSRIAKIWAADGDFTSITIGTFTTGVTNTQVLYSDAGAIAGDTGMTWTKASDLLTVGGLALGAGSLTMSGSLADTTNRVTKGWFTAIQSTNSPILDDLTASELVASNGTKQLQSLAVATYPSLTEISYVKDVTSAIQSQINAKGTGTVTSVAAITLGTTGTDLSSSVATGTTTPVITLNVPTASTSNRGALSSTDWDTFNGKGVGDMLLGTAQSVTETKTFTKGKLLVKGTSTGTTDLTTANTSATSYTATFPAKTGTVAMTTDITGTNSGTNTGDEIVATGAELDTGTDNVKYASAKAIKDSHNVPSVAPSTAGKVLTSNGTDWISEAPVAGGDMVLADAQSNTGIKTFDKGTLKVKGTSTGSTDLTTANASATSYTATLQAATGTLAYSADIPTKAAGTDLDTGTDDAKFATSKALVDSFHYRTKQTSEASNATPAPTGGYAKNEHFITALATGTATFAAPSGTPLNGNTLLIRVTSDGTIRTLAWNEIYNVIGVTLPVATIASKTTYVGCKYNSTNSKWDVLAVGQEAA